LDKVLVSDEVKVLKKITHRIKRGETLSEISEKYDVSINDIKKVNKIKNNKIQKGKVLKIPTTEMEIKQIAKYKFEPIQTISNTDYQSYTSEKSIEKIYLIANQDATNYDLNGLVLENNNAGILYHSIGVNGAKFSDYNKYPLFFEQLKVLKLDLLVISLGTNESFEKLTTDKYLLQVQKFIDNLKSSNPNIPILFTTPPPSLFKRRNLNTIAMDYAEKLTNFANSNGCALWDMHAQMGGVYSVNRNFSAGLVNLDKVHYTKNGYEKQGELFTEAFLQAYQNFITQTDFK
jgi:LysM repeat protein